MQEERQGTSCHAAAIVATVLLASATSPVDAKIRTLQGARLLLLCVLHAPGMTLTMSLQHITGSV